MSLILRTARQLQPISSYRRYLNHVSGNDNNNPIDHYLVKKYVYDKLTFDLPFWIWQRIDVAFSDIWNVELGYGTPFYWDELVTRVHGKLAGDNILVTREQVNEVVNLMLTYIKKTGRFLNDDN